MTDEKAAREFSDTTREKMAGTGVAMPDGSYPIPDKDALGRAILAFGRAKDPAATKKHIIRRARALGATAMLPKEWMGGAGKSMTEMKAEALTPKALESWLAGERSRRIMVVPFGGPLPGGKAGLDLDYEYFDDATDLYGPFPALKRTRERLVDWHHDDDTGVPSYVPTMKGTILGRINLDEGPSTLRTDDGDYEGVAADFWAKAGEQRLALVKALQKRGAAIYGSSQAVKGATHVEDDGHIALWPLYRHTLSTSPQNIYAVVPPLKAVLTADLPFDDVGAAALRAALSSLDDLGPDLRATLGCGPGKRAAKARQVDALVEEATRLLARMRTHPLS
jgi:hypothetical protein